MTIGMRFVPRDCGYCGRRLQEERGQWGGPYGAQIWVRCPKRFSWWEVLLGRETRHTSEFVRYEA